MFHHPIVQIAYFVSDVRQVTARMVQTSGTGPFHVMDKIELTWGKRRGQACNFVHTSAYGQ